MVGTVLNAGGILLGGILARTVRKQFSGPTQYAIKGLLGVFTVWVGLKLAWMSFGGGLLLSAKQLLIILLALTLGRLTGKVLRIQRLLNRLGQFAKARLAQVESNQPVAWSDGFVTCSILYCVAPMSPIGALLDGLGGQWQTLGLKAVMDCLATMAFVGHFGWSAVLSIIPVIAWQGTLTLAAGQVAPFLTDRGLMEAVTGTAGLLVFSIALVILELRKMELADYLPSLAVAPLIAWLWK